MKKGLFNPVKLKTLLFLISLAAGTVAAEHVNQPAISIIIDDMGYRGVHDINALDLPGPVTYAVMPHSPYSLRISERAYHEGNTVILHLPMEAIENDKNRFLGPGALKMEMDEDQFISTLTRNMNSIPHVIGVNNHMGSLLTGQKERMEWLMKFLQIRRIFYIDSVTSNRSVASNVAREMNVPYLERDVFLDNKRDPEYINLQFDKLVKIAKRKGTAIAIGHPHPETINVLMTNLGNLGKYGVHQVSIKDLVNRIHSAPSGRLSLLK